MQMVGVCGRSRCRQAVWQEQRFCLVSCHAGIESHACCLNHICRSLSGPSPIILQLGIIHELSEGMKSCSTAFIAVAVAGIALSV